MKTCGLCGGTRKQKEFVKNENLSPLDDDPLAERFTIEDGLCPNCVGPMDRAEFRLRREQGIPQHRKWRS